MHSSSPHYLLFAHTDARSEPARWKVVLKKADGSHTFEASDAEPEARGERLELLAVLRGLEALDEPSRVTLVTSSRYVRRGLMYGLSEWRTNDWAWEWYGQMVPVKNRDLWQRLDRALEFHHVECRRWRLDNAHFTMDRPQAEPPTSPISQRRAAPQPTAPMASQRTRDNRNSMIDQPKPRRSAEPRSAATEPRGMADWFGQTASSFFGRLAEAGQLAAAGRRGVCSAE
jgi:ribonuclease HI